MTSSEQDKIVTLIPSATEIVCALGARERIVGVSHECDFPLGINGLPACCEPNFSPKGPSGDIDKSVKHLVENSLSVYKVHADRLRELHPKTIVTQSKCDVCGVTADELQVALNDWMDDRPDIVSLSPTSMRDVWQDIERVAEAIGTPKAGADLIRALTIRLQEISGAAMAAARQKGAKPKVLCIEWMEPLMTAGHWVPELIDLTGGESLLADAGKDSAWITPEQMVQSDADVILIMPCGYDIQEIEDHMHELTDRPEWPGLSAVKNGDVFVIDGNQYFNRPGPRLVESAEILAEILWPEQIELGHRGIAYKKI